MLNRFPLNVNQRCNYKRALTLFNKEQKKKFHSNTPRTSGKFLTLTKQAEVNSILTRTGQHPHNIQSYSKVKIEGDKKETKSDLHILNQMFHNFTIATICVTRVIHEILTSTVCLLFWEHVGLGF